MKFKKVNQPLHQDKNLDHAWWNKHEIQFGNSKKSYQVYPNFVRDGSGRYDGYCVVIHGKPTVVTTVELAKTMLQKIKQAEKNYE